MKLFEIEKIVLNKYSKLNIEEQKNYLVKEVRKILDNNIKIDMNINDLNYYIELNNNKIDFYVLKLIKENKITRKEIFNKKGDKNYE